MKISKNQLKSMIMEELQSVLSEQPSSPYGQTMGLDPVDSITFDPNYGLDPYDPRYQPLETEEDRRFTGPTKALAAKLGLPPLGTSTKQQPPAAAAAQTTKMPAVGTGGPKIYSGGYRYTKNPDGSFTAYGADLPAGGRRFSADSRAGRSIAAEIGGGVYDPKEKMFLQRRTAADVMPGTDDSPSYRLTPARRDIEEMIYEALLEEFGDK